MYVCQVKQLAAIRMQGLMVLGVLTKLPLGLKVMSVLTPLPLYI